LSQQPQTAGWLTINAPEGTAVTVTTQAGSMTALVTGGPGFAPSMPPQAHLGLEFAKVYQVELQRPQMAADVVQLDGITGRGITISYRE
jgi:hypothetical protein